MMRDKTVLLGVTGSIAAYKAVDLASKLTQAGAKVDVVMTECATEFVTPLSFSSITHRPTVTDMFDTPDEFEIEHVALAERANVVVIAPATANVIAKLAAGIAHYMLPCSVLATRAPVIVAPAMKKTCGRTAPRRTTWPSCGQKDSRLLSREAVLWPVAPGGRGAWLISRTS